MVHTAVHCHNTRLWLAADVTTNKPEVCNFANWPSLLKSRHYLPHCSSTAFYKYLLKHQDLDERGMIGHPALSPCLPTLDLQKRFILDNKQPLDKARQYGMGG